MPGGEVALDEVWGWWCEPAGDRGALAPPQAAALEPVLAHQALDALAVDGVPEAVQFGVDAADPVGALVYGMGLADLRDQGILGSSRRSPRRPPHTYASRRRLPSHQDTLPRICKIHCQCVHTPRSPHSPLSPRQPENPWSAGLV